MTVKKVRKVFCDEPITLRFEMKNPLMTEVIMEGVRVVGRYEGSEENEDCYVLDKGVSLKGKETKEVVVQIIPRRPGTLTLERIDWDLFSSVSCSFSLTK